MAPWPPKTINHLKQHAKALKRAEEITHCAALERVARDAGFKNYGDAHRSLAAGYGA